MGNSFEQVANSVVNFYYQTFTSNRSGLSALYRSNSMLTFEGAPVQGTEAIINKLTSLPITSVVPVLDTLDAQPSSSEGGVLVCVTGRMQVDGGMPEGMRFSQTFQIIPEGSSYYIQNDIFRLNYG